MGLSPDREARKPRVAGLAQPIGWEAGAHHADGRRPIKGNAMPPRIPAPPSGLESTAIRRRAVLLSGLALPLGLLAARAAPATGRRPGAADPAHAAGADRPLPSGHRVAGPHRPVPARPWVPGIPFREMVISMLYPAREVDGHPREPYFTPSWRARTRSRSASRALNWPITPPTSRPGAAARGRLAGRALLPRPGRRAVRDHLPRRGPGQPRLCRGHDRLRPRLRRRRAPGRAPGGVCRPCAHPTAALTIKEIVSRAADVSFVLDQLAVINRGGNPDHEQPAAAARPARLA